MLTFYNEHHAQHCAPAPTAVAGLPAAPAASRPAPLALVLGELQRRGLGDIVTPHRAPLVSLERIHRPRYLHFLRNAWSEWCTLDPRHLQQAAQASNWPIRGLRSDLEPDSFMGRLGLYSMDATALNGGTWNAAKTGADCAINAAHALRLGQRGSFALTYPAGHHAGADFFGAGCFLNNAALAAQHLLDDGLKRVAILDLDQHHGNGTQAIFYGRSDVLTISLHADPRTDFPYYAGYGDETGAGDGHGANLNLPLERGASGAHWLAALETACLRLGLFAPEALVVALGVGARGTPAGGTAGAASDGGFALQAGDYLRIGERIGWLGLPTAFVFEGGSQGDTGIHTVNVLEGYETATDP